MQDTKQIYFEISSKERLYFSIRLAFSLVFYFGILYAYFAFFSGTAKDLFLKSLILIPITLIILFIYSLRNGIYIGLIKSFSVKLSDRQLPEIYQTVKSFSERMDIRHIPKVYLLQSGGSLNAFAKKFFNSNYVVIYSDLLEAYYEGDIDAVEFVIAHELGHIKRNHFLKELLLFPSIFIPFLSMAYYRACELTCDNIGKQFNKKGAVNGLLILAGGKKLYKELNVQEYIRQKYSDAGIWRWFVEKLLTHPNLYKRIENVYEPGLVNQITRKTTSPKPEIKEQPIQPISSPVGDIQVTEDDHSRYMPG